MREAFCRDGDTPAERRTPRRAGPWLFWLLLLLGIVTFAGGAVAQAPAPASPFSVNVNLGDKPAEMATSIQILLFMTVLSLAPAIIMLMTSFTRIVIVLGFVRTALGVQSAPSNQIIVGLSLFLTVFIMGPIMSRINTEAIQPYSAKQLTFEQAAQRASVPLRQFMLKQTRPGEVEFFLGLSGAPPTSVDDLPLTVVIPAFVVSELRTAFQMGFLIFIPFMVIDFLVASTLMAMGMMMMPPTVVSLPFKLLLFVLVDGWHLVIRSLVQSFGVG